MNKRQEYTLRSAIRSILREYNDEGSSTMLGALMKTNPTRAKSNIRGSIISAGGDVETAANYLSDQLGDSISPSTLRIYIGDDPSLAELQKVEKEEEESDKEDKSKPSDVQKKKKDEEDKQRRDK